MTRCEKRKPMPSATSWSESSRARSVSAGATGGPHRTQPQLGQHLTQTVRTGTYCAYAPDPGASAAWLVSP